MMFRKELIPTENLANHPKPWLDFTQMLVVPDIDLPSKQLQDSETPERRFFFLKEESWTKEARTSNNRDLLTVNRGFQK